MTSQQTTTLLRASAWVLVVALIGLAALFGYTVYLDRQEAIQSTPALRVIQEIKKQVRAQPNNVVFRVRLGEGYAAAGKYQQAIEQFNAALKLDPKHPGAISRPRYGRHDHQAQGPGGQVLREGRLADGHRDGHGDRRPARAGALQPRQHGLERARVREGRRLLQGGVADPQGLVGHLLAAFPSVHGHGRDRRGDQVRGVLARIRSELRAGELRRRRSCTCRRRTTSRHPSTSGGPSMPTPRRESRRSFWSSSEPPTLGLPRPGRLWRRSRSRRSSTSRSRDG